MSLNHTKQKSWPQRLLALLAAVVLCAALPAAALAEENTASIQTQVSETDEDTSPGRIRRRAPPKTAGLTLPCQLRRRRIPPPRKPPRPASIWKATA